MSLRFRAILSMLLLVVISGGVSAFIGGYLLWRQLAQETGNRVRQDLNAAHEFYNQRLEAMRTVLRYTALGERFSQAVVRGETDYLAARLAAVRQSASFDVLLVTDGAGRVLYRAHQPGRAGDLPADDRLVGLVLGGAPDAAGTMLVPLATLGREDPALAARAGIRILETPKAGPAGPAELDSAMMLCAASPVRGPDGKLSGVLRAGVLLNRNYELVDQVQNTVFRDEHYRGKLLGTATIFQGDVRVSTNVQRQDGSRAIGTRASAEVYDCVLGRGQTWLGPAWVVNDWYVSAYDPIHDVDGRPVGMLYVGVLQQKYSDLARRTYALFALMIFLGLVAAGLVAWKLSGRITRPISNLASASVAIARGEFSPELPVESADEIGALTRSFNTMARSLRERDELLRERTRQQLTRSERLASIGRLAAGVAHEINNPLTGVLTFAHLLHRKAPEGSQDRQDLETIINATTRCKDIVRGLLGFSRQSEPHKQPSDLNAVVREAANLIRNQARISRVEIAEELAAGLPAMVIDGNQLQEAAVNLLLNAIDAMPQGGRLAVRTRPVAGPPEAVELEVADTGCGIPAANLEHIFDPFFTTKPAGKGTGLGLAIVYGVVTEHGGQINLASEVGRGTTVTVRLPAPAAPGED